MAAGSRLSGVRHSTPFLFLLACSSFAQTDAGGFRAGPVYTDRFPSVAIVLDVSLSQSAKVREVRPADVLLIEDGIATVRASGVDPFKATGRGLALVMATDVRTSLEGRTFDAIKIAGRAVAAELGTADRAGLVSFSTDERVEVPLGATAVQFRQGVDRLSTRGETTQLYRALVKALQMFEQEPRLPERRRILLISDGTDEQSSYTFENVRDMAQRLRVAIDTVVLVRDPKTPNTVGISALERLSDVTGGNSRMASTVEGVQDAATTAVRWLQFSPVARFDLENTRADGRWHELGVRWVVFGGDRTVRILAPKGGLEPVWWIAGTAGALLLVLAIVAVMRRRPQPEYVVQAPAPMIAPPPTPLPEPVRLWLVAERGPLAGKRFLVEGDHFWIGAGEGNQLVVEDDTVSWSHACVLSEQGNLFLFDDSRNGTLVNGERVNKARRPLAAGDSIQVGESLFRLERR